MVRDVWCENESFLENYNLYSVLRTHPKRCHINCPRTHSCV